MTRAAVLAAALWAAFGPARADAPPGAVASIADGYLAVVIGIGLGGAVLAAAAANDQGGYQRRVAQLAHA